MFEMAKMSIVLFLKGRLFQNPVMVARQAAAGIVITALVLLVFARAGLPLWAAAALAGFFGGMLQPYLFRDLKYR